MSDDEKACPFCAEVIKKAAIKCRHCGAALAAPTVDSRAARSAWVVVALAVVPVAVLLLALSATRGGSADSGEHRTTVADRSHAGHVECERQLKRLSEGYVLSVPKVPDMGGKYEYYFAWNRGRDSQPIATKGGNSTGSCVLDVTTFEGSVTLDGKDLGSFGPQRRK